ncbi:hypothetical protein NDU88_000237 [Pleurodeles waltl]|uniref:Uncharacterized protein n=1 Tax=Pleurodeles waltl TaxID=8319 RepID=A0AAV7S528_PLEWA|nr:hypothetical protein NDU88_000237 [Pleurodeles waltl]
MIDDGRLIRELVGGRAPGRSGGSGSHAETQTEHRWALQPMGPCWGPDRRTWSPPELCNSTVTQREAAEA